MKWDLPLRQKYRDLKGKPIKAFKGAECLTFRSIAHARDQLGISRFLITKHLKSGEPIKEFIFEYT